MKALVYEDVERLVFQDVSDPAPGEGEHLIRVKASGICGSDMHAYLGHDARRPAPLIFGHEAAGVVEGGPMDGARVTVNPLMACLECPACKAGRENLCPERRIISLPPREGAFAQYIAMPARNLVSVPAHIPLEKAALAEPLAVSWHAARLTLEALHPSMERRALIIGGGAIGLAAALALRAMGARSIVIAEPGALRREFLSKSCGEEVIAEAGGMFEIVVDAVGVDATRAAASACTYPGGVITHIGLGAGSSGLDIRRMTLQEITFIGAYTYTMQDFQDTAAAIFNGRLGPLDWTEARPLEEGAGAFRDLRAGAVAAPKIMLIP